MSTTSCVWCLGWANRVDDPGAIGPSDLTGWPSTPPPKKRTWATPTVTSFLVRRAAARRPLIIGMLAAGAAAGAGGGGLLAWLLLLLPLLLLLLLGPWEEGEEEGRMRRPRSPSLTRVRERKVQRPSSVRDTIQGTLCVCGGGGEVVV